MKGENVIFSSSSDEWGTPQEVFDKLDDEFHFTLDPCATEENAKCEKYYTMSDNGLLPSWGGAESVLQSTVFKHSTVGIKGVLRSTEGQYACCSPDPGEDRYTVVS